MPDLVWGPVHHDMMEAVAGDPTDIAGVVDQLVRVQGLLEKVPSLYQENPVADFNKLYTTITEEILHRHRVGGFSDLGFLTMLDVEFAKRYFRALRLWGEGSPATPQAWTVLFTRYDDRDLRSLPCAVAGVNAHINYDLSFALLATWKQLGPNASGSPQHDDYLLINQVFFDAIPALRRSFLEKWQLYIDRLNGRFDDWYQNLLVQITRDLAWDRAMTIWALREDPVAVERARRAMDHQTAFVGRVLLSPFCSLLQ